MDTVSNGANAPTPPEQQRREQAPRAPAQGEPRKYQQLRDQMKTGDLLLFQGNRLLSGVIERLSDSPYSHVAIVARWHRRVVAFQADLRGVEVLPASTMVCRYSGKVDWWSLKPDLRETVFNEDELFNTALTLLGVKYGYWRLIGLGLRILLGRTLNPKDAHATPDSLFCSEFVSRCYRNATGGVLDVNQIANDSSTSPSDFARSGFFEMRHQLFDGSDGQACTGLLEATRGKRRTQRRALAWDGTKRHLPPSASSQGSPPL